MKGSENFCADLLSRVPQSAMLSQEEDSAYEPDISDKAYVIVNLNSNRFEPKEYVRCTFIPPVTLKSHLLVTISIWWPNNQMMTY